MIDVAIERAKYRRERGEAPRLLARSPGLSDVLLSPLADLLVAFGERPAGIVCSGAVFAQPLGGNHVAIVQVNDGPTGPSGWPSLDYFALVPTRGEYQSLGADPIGLARRNSPVANRDISGVDVLRLPAEPLAKRSVESVRAVLKRIKAHALPENVDPEKLPALTIDNAESPTLLGGAQILVDGGKLAFERDRPDASVIEALWTLLPHRLRGQIWPATFAFNNDLGFDVVVVPRLDGMPLAGYTTEADAGDYPAGSYELALQAAAEAGDERELNAVFERRTSNETLRLGVKLLVGISLIVLATRFLTPTPPPPDASARAATVAGIVGVRDPWMALQMLDVGNQIYRKR